MLKILKKKINEEGAVNVGVMFAAVLTLLSSLFFFVLNDIKGQINVVQAQTNTNTASISGLNQGAKDLQSEVDKIYQGLQNKGIIK